MIYKTNILLLLANLTKSNIIIYCFYAITLIQMFRGRVFENFIKDTARHNCV